MRNMVRAAAVAAMVVLGGLQAPAAQAYGPTEPPGPVRNVEVINGWGAASVQWWASDTGGGWETGYQLRVIDPTGAVVTTATTGGFDTHHSFGRLENGTTYTIEITAENDIGAGPAISAQATPYVPDSHVTMYAFAECPGWSVVNGANPFPIWFTWESGKVTGDGVAREKDSATIGSVADGRKVAIYVDGELEARADDSNCPRVAKK